MLGLARLRGRLGVQEVVSRFTKGGVSVSASWVIVRLMQGSRREGIRGKLGFWVFLG